MKPQYTDLRKEIHPRGLWILMFLKQFPFLSLRQILQLFYNNTEYSKNCAAEILIRSMVKLELLVGFTLRYESQERGYMISKKGGKFIDSYLDYSGINHSDDLKKTKHTQPSISFNRIKDVNLFTPSPQKTVRVTPPDHTDMMVKVCAFVLNNENVFEEEFKKWLNEMPVCGDLISHVEAKNMDLTFHPDLYFRENNIFIECENTFPSKERLWRKISKYSKYYFKNAMEGKEKNFQLVFLTNSVKEAKMFSDLYHNMYSDWKKIPKKMKDERVEDIHLHINFWVGSFGKTGEIAVKRLDPYGVGIYEWDFLQKIND